MSITKAAKTFLLTLFLAAPTHATLISETDILNNWSTSNSTGWYVYSGNIINNAIWSQSGSVITNGGNRSGSLLSDFSASGDFSFSTRIAASGDNDAFGILFGVQDFNNNYSLSWGGGGVGPVNGIQLRRNDGAVSSILGQQAGNWVSGVVYDFIASRSGNDISVSVLNGATTVFSTTVTDSTYATGGVGFDTFSQSTSLSFGATDFSSVPAPAPLVLFGLGLIGIGFRSKRR